MNLGLHASTSTVVPLARVNDVVIEVDQSYSDTGTLAAISVELPANHSTTNNTSGTKLMDLHSMSVAIDRFDDNDLSLRMPIGIHNEVEING